MIGKVVAVQPFLSFKIFRSTDYFLPCIKKIFLLCQKLNTIAKKVCRS